MMREWAPWPPCNPCELNALSARRPGICAAGIARLAGHFSSACPYVTAATACRPPDALTPAGSPQEEALAEQAMEAEVDLLSMEAAEPTDAKSSDPGRWQGSWGELLYSQDDLGSNGSAGRPSGSAPDLGSSSGSDHGATTSSRSAGSPLQGLGEAGQQAAPSSSAAAATGLSSSYLRDDEDDKRWPILREGDGGRHVHALHAALERQGFWPGEDDMRWWQFGDTTVSALQSAQVGCRCCGLRRLPAAP